MACQGPDGLKVICKLPDLVNVFVLLSQSVLDIEKSGVLKTQENKEAFHVLYKLTRKIAKKLNALSETLNKYRNYLVEMIKSKATDKERPLLLQKVTGILQDLRQEMGKLAPKLSQLKSGARDASNRKSVDQAINLIVNKEAQLEDVGRAEDSLYRSSRIPNREEMLEPQTGLDASTNALVDVRNWFKFFHTIAQVDTGLMKLEQDIGDFLTEILLLFQEEIVELKMLIRLCQSSVTSTDKDKDRKMLAALNHVRRYMGADEEDDDEDEEEELAIIDTECEPMIRTWKEITNQLFEEGKVIT